MSPEKPTAPGGGAEPGRAAAEPGRTPRGSVGRILRTLVDRWQGVLLTLVVGVATLWLASTGQLVLYIHPRYVVFTVVLTVIGMVLALAALARPASADHDHGDHDGHGHADDAHGELAGHDDHTAEEARPAPRVRLRRLRVVGYGVGTVVTVAIALAVVALPPATLTSATAGQRDVNASTASLKGTSVSDATSASSAASARFSVLDWAGLLRQTTDLSFYDGKTADIVGFVTPSDSDPDDVFYVSRFVITCCAVDAQPVGVPVYLENWKNTVSADEWVEVKGGFATNRSRASTDPIALVPTSMEKVGQPSDPYLY
ncbi:TIGR03943 family putative permease subunit [Frigoribacterium sp. 2-23]|uniref:TIGR03943 family putative permease subunit n=1 Tax=Frigoribacterium sp. 2-23 TaxID=3415006 RepID=UPI003C6FC29F